MERAKLLIIWHSRTGAAKAAAQAAYDAAQNVASRADGQDRAIAVELMAAENVAPADIIAAEAYLFICPENLASISGAMKEMFDRCYYPVLGRIDGHAYATIIAAGSDGTGAERQIDRILTGWRLRRVANSVIINMEAQKPEEILAMKILSSNQLNICQDAGTAMAEALHLRII